HCVLDAAKWGHCDVDRAPMMTMSDLKALSEHSSRKTQSRRCKIAHYFACNGWQILFDHIKWIDNYILVNLTRVKVRDQLSFLLFNSPLEWRVYPILAIACQLVADPFSVTTVLQPLADEDIINCWQRVSTPSLRPRLARRGAAVHASANSSVHLFGVTHRGNWKLDNTTKVFQYIVETDASDHKVAPK
ncbi:TPA: hypothetical protein N0F65_005612, partial [Lagenidium giganteum]